MRIDDRGPVVLIDEERRRGLAEVFERQPDVVAAYLFGSQARGDAGPLSDVDLALWLDDDLKPGVRMSRQLALSAQAASLLGTDEVELALAAQPIRTCSSRAATADVRAGSLRVARRPRDMRPGAH